MWTPDTADTMVAMSALDRSGVMRPLDRSVRLVRSIAAALVCVVAASAGHLSGGGAMPAVAAAAVFAGAVPVAWFLSSRRITPGQMIGLLVLCQVGVHLGAPHADMSMGPAMLVGHVVATLASAAVLARGEHFVWELARLLRLRLAPLLHLLVPVPSMRPLLAVVAPRPMHDARLTYSRSLRGPPVGLV
jgi:hypothetical protein